MINASWQEKRVSLNHDWLMNRFLVDLGSFLNILYDRVEDSILERRFVQYVLPQWPKRSIEAIHLVTTFETEMSPRKLFERMPLNRCAPETMNWLPNLVHYLWLTRCRVQDLLEDANNALALADAAYSRLIQLLATCTNTESALDLRQHREEFTAFRAACEVASKAINRFPSRIEIV